MPFGYIFLQPTAPRVNPDAFLAADTAEMLVHELKNLLKKPDALEVSRLRIFFPV